MLTSLGLVLLLGMALGALAKRLGLPSLVGMLIAGMILGPYALNLLSDSLLNISADLRQLALIIILTRAVPGCGGPEAGGPSGGAHVLCPRLL